MTIGEEAMALNHGSTVTKPDVDINAVIDQEIMVSK